MESFLDGEKTLLPEGGVLYTPEANLSLTWGAWPQWENRQAPNGAKTATGVIPDFLVIFRQNCFFFVVGPPQGQGIVE